MLAAVAEHVREGAVQCGTERVRAEQDVRAGEPECAPSLVGGHDLVPQLWRVGRLGPSGTVHASTRCDRVCAVGEVEDQRVPPSAVNSTFTPRSSPVFVAMVRYPCRVCCTASSVISALMPSPPSGE